MTGNKWFVVSEECIGSNPPITTYECVIGKDPKGREWHARAKYREQERTFHVWFDHMDGEMPFLRNEVVYADNYWGAMKERYHLVKCRYKDIQMVVDEFAHRNSIL